MSSDQRKQKRAAYDRKRREQITEDKRQEEAKQKRFRRLNMSADENQAVHIKVRDYRAARLNSQSDFAESERVRKLKKPPPSKYVARNPFSRPMLHTLGEKKIACKSCGALHFEAEKTYRGTFSDCCGSGSINLKALNDYPSQLKTWLTEHCQDAKHFRSNIRKYNSAFAFASFGYQTLKFPSGPQAFVIHGQVYHKTAKSINDSKTPSYAQLYILDPDFANKIRTENDYNDGCQKEMFAKINSILLDINPYAMAYKMMGKIIQENQNRPGQVKMWITNDRQHDIRRYNLPVANEVAAVFVSEDGEPPFERDIAVYPLDTTTLQHISILSPNCDPMTYPILFPHGDCGWQRGLAKSEKIVDAIETFEDNDNEDANEAARKNISMLQFYSYRLQERKSFNPLLHAGKLTQQFIVDSFLKVEAQRIQWNRLNQKKLRVDLYLGLMDFVNSKAEKNDLKPGRIVILPSSFTGGKRFMQQNYQDAMVLVANFGKPDLFITFTCNPKWFEITSQLSPNETAIDRPDVVATVFNLKLKEFMNDVTSDKGGVLGKVDAFLSVIEFQKRGLPHCHMLFILSKEDKLRRPEDVDSMVSAEIPDSNDIKLLEVVKTCMFHGPCGSFNTKSPCMSEEKGIFKCSKKFPKDFSVSTNLNVDGYPIYRRRMDGKKLDVRGFQLDNRWIVPYNPYLSRKYNAHINVEVCSSVQSVKYIFKYIYKGHDAAVVHVTEGTDVGTYNWDEIQTFLDTRYVSAPEGMWRLKKYEMSNRSHAVERLPVHLPSQQTVVFEVGSEEQELRKAEKRGTKLTKWFSLNQEDPTAKPYLYCEIPYHYVWRKNAWHIRKKGGNKILPRMYAVSPRDMERFCMRLLLMHVRGAESFEDLRTVNGVLYESFLEAAKCLKLLDDDKEWNNAMEEANNFRMPVELRQLFAAILVHARPADSKLLYQTFKKPMYEDFLQSHSEYMAEQMALKDIQENLSQFGYSCSEFGLPNPVDAFDLPEDSCRENDKMEAEKLVSMMNREQKIAFNTVMNAVNGKLSEKCFFLSGAGGYGKTFLYKALTCAVLSQGGLVKAVAPTGLAATLLKGGSTVHRGFGISIHLDKDTVSRFKQGTKEWKELLLLKLIIWDEISMCHVHLLNAVDRSLRDLLNCDEPFGGIVIVVGGDFQQQAPVVVHGNRVQIVEACVKSSPLWKKFQELKLLTNMRVNSDEIEFAKWLLSIGSGKKDGLESDFVSISDSSLCTNIISSVFGHNINDLSPLDLASRAVLCPKNEDTLAINEKILLLIHGNMKSYLSVDSVTDCDSEAERSQYPVEFLNSLTPMGMPPHILKLKKGCCVMLLRNMNPKRGLCNGTRLIVESLGTNLVECSIFNGERQGQKVFIPRISLDASDSDLPFKLRRKQYPLRLAYSMTITKSQGQTFDRIGVYLPEPVFTHGQLYTAFSRVRSESGLFVEIEQCSRQGQIFESDNNTYAYNCVYREILM